MFLGRKITFLHLKKKTKQKKSCLQISGCSVSASLSLSLSLSHARTHTHTRTHTGFFCRCNIGVKMRCSSLCDCFSSLRSVNPTAPHTLDMLIMWNLQNNFVNFPCIRLQSPSEGSSPGCSVRHMWDTFYLCAPSCQPWHSFFLLSIPGVSQQSCHFQLAIS